MAIVKTIFKTFILSVLVVAQVHFAYAQTASILPPARTIFFDANGNPLSSGTVDFYIPPGTTRKTTWKDAAETIPNTNPVVLSADGGALILGSGSYRQVVKDRLGNLIWDQVTSSAGSGGTGSTATGDGDLVGTIKPWAGMTAPNQYAFTYGQEISRTTFAVLFTAITSTQAVFCSSGSPILTGLGDTTNFWIGMPVELTCLASGNSTVISKTSTTVTLAANANVTTNTNATFFSWGRGNGTTTFNLPDFRGIVPAGNNNMGGIASSNLNNTYFGAQNPNSTGAFGGSQSSNIVLSVGNLPSHTHTSSSLTDPGHAHASRVDSGAAAGSTGTPVSGTTSNAGNTSSSTTGITISASTGVNSTGLSTPIVASLIQPTKTVNYIIKTTPDTNSATASGVTSIQGMTGSIACGAGMLCTGNVISSTTNIIQPPVNVQNYGAKCDAVTLTGNTINGSNVVTSLSTTNGLIIGQNFLGGSIQIGSTITAIGASQVTISLPATGTFNGIALLAATDDSSVIQNILNTNRTVLIPALCYVGTSTITVGNLAWQTLTGVNPEGSALISTSSVNPIISVVSTIPSIVIKNLLISRPSFVLPSATAFGIKFNGFNDNPEVTGNEIVNSYIGVKLTGTGYGLVNYNFVRNNLSDGFLFQDPTIANEFQWVLNTNLSQSNGGCGYHVITPSISIGGQPRTSMGTWNNTITFNNSVCGASFNGNATIPLQGIRLVGGFIGTDLGSELIFDTYNTSLGGHQITAINMEQSGSGPCVTISANNTGGMYFSNNIANACNTSSLNVAAGATNINWAGGALTAAGTFSIVNAGGLQVTNTNVNGSISGPLSNSGTYIGRMNSLAAANTAVTVAEGGTGAITFTSNLPLIGNGTTNVTQGTVSGNTTKFGTVSGAFTSGNCLKSDASGNIVDQGAACGAGGGGTPGGANTQVQYNNLGAFGGITGATTNGTALTLVAPVLGTPASATLTNATGLPTSGLTGTLLAAQEPAHTGDITNTAGSLATTLATVNANVGSFGSATQCTTFTVNAKGLITAASQNSCISGLVIGTTVISSGGANGVLYDSSGGILINTAAGTNGQLFLGNTGNPPQWGTMSGDGTITNTGVLTVTKTNGTSFGALATVVAGTGIATAAAINIGTAGSFVVNGGALGSPSSAGTIPAFTLGGTISGGGNQLNNIIIGTTTPLAGIFTTLTANTSLSTPLHTSPGVHTFGSNGGAFAGLISTGQQWELGANAAPDARLTVNDNTAAGVAPSLATQIHTIAADGAIGGLYHDVYGSQVVVGYRRADGTQAAKTAVLNNEIIGSFGSYTWDGSAYALGSAIDFTAVGNQTGANHGSSISFRMTPSGSASPTTSATLFGSGGFSVNTTSDPGAGSITMTGAIQARGTVPVGTTGSCVASSFTGGATAGKFAAAVCVAGTIILSSLPTAPNGYTCNAQDQTTPADTLKQTANTTTSVTFTSTTAAADVITFNCMAW